MKATFVDDGDFCPKKGTHLIGTFCPSMTGIIFYNVKSNPIYFVSETEKKVIKN